MTRHDILTALHTHLESYSWQSFGPSVYLGRSVFDPDSDALPVLTILPGLETAQPRYASDLITLTVDVSVLISFANGQDMLEECEAILAELKVAMFSGQLLVGTTDLVGLQYTSGGIADYPSELGPHVATVGVQFSLQYEDDHQTITEE